MKQTGNPLSVGDWVEVRSKQEILQTLDKAGQLEGMPFMPEMFSFCGKRFQVYKRAHKTCDTVFPVRGRRVSNAVHLDTRCDGSAHGGCEATCLIFWKEAWLKRVEKNSPKQSAVENLPNAIGRGSCTEADVLTATQLPNAQDGEIVYVCQATRLPYATTDLEWWEMRQYLEDYTSGNVTLWQVVCGAVYFSALWLSKAGLKLGRPIRWFYDEFYPLWGGTPFPRKTGTIPVGESTPTGTLDLQPGDLVRIKSHDEILKTLDTHSKNRGLFFDAEEVPHCGSTRRVIKRVTKIVNERTGKMRVMKNPCIILEDAYCQSRFSECRLFCPRSIYAYWREIWLERVGPEQASGQAQEEEPLAARR